MRHVAADVQDLAAGARMRAHHRMLDRWRSGALLLCHRRLPGAAPRGIEVMHGAQALQLAISRIIQRVIGCAHIRVERIAAGDSAEPATFSSSLGCWLKSLKSGL